MCRVLKVCRSGYYDWLSQRAPCARALKNAQLSASIEAIFTKNNHRYGSRRIRRDLLKQGYQVSRRRICRLMREQGLFCKTRRKFKQTTDSNHTLPIAENHLNRRFDWAAPNQAYVGDITYIATQEGWFITVIDLFSRRVVGWSMNERMQTNLVNDAMLMAIYRRQPDKGLLWHTDRGSQYAAHSHRELLNQHGIVQSMSRKGNCWDNAVAESFFHTLKTELTHHQQFTTREEAKQKIFEYIEIYYNRERMHSANDYLSPVEYEAAHAAS